MDKRRIDCVGIILGESGYCVSVRVGGCSVYMHGTTDQVRVLGWEILAAAAKKDAELLEVEAIRAMSISTTELEPANVA